MVISGGNFKPDTLKPKEVVSLLLDDEEIETKCKWIVFGFIVFIAFLLIFLYLSIEHRSSKDRRAKRSR